MWYDFRRYIHMKTIPGDGLVLYIIKGNRFSGIESGYADVEAKRLLHRTICSFCIRRQNDNLYGLALQLFERGNFC